MMRSYKKIKLFKIIKEIFKTDINKKDKHYHIK